MYITVDLESIVIWDTITFTNIGPSSTFFSRVPFFMVNLGHLPQFLTWSAHLSMIKFLMHASICCEICASLVSFSFLFYLSMWYFLALSMHSSIDIFPYSSNMLLPSTSYIEVHPVAAGLYWSFFMTICIFPDQS